MDHLQTITIVPAAKEVSLERIAVKYDQQTAFAVAAYMRARGVYVEVVQVDEHWYQVKAA